MRRSRRPRPTGGVRRNGGVEGDKTFYFGEHARTMKGPKDIDLDVQPPPDLAIEVEVTHSADDAVIGWGRLGVPEVWRFDPIALRMLFLVSSPERHLRPRSIAAWPSRCSPPMTSSSRCNWPIDLGMADWHAAARPMGPEGDRSPESERRRFDSGTIRETGDGFWPVHPRSMSATAWRDELCARRQVRTRAGRAYSSGPDDGRRRRYDGEPGLSVRSSSAFLCAVSGFALMVLFGSTAYGHDDPERRAVPARACRRRRSACMAALGDRRGAGCGITLRTSADREQLYTSSPIAGRSSPARTTGRDDVIRRFMDCQTCSMARSASKARGRHRGRCNSLCHGEDVEHPSRASKASSSPASRGVDQADPPGREGARPEPDTTESDRRTRHPETTREDTP